MPAELAEHHFLGFLKGHVVQAFKMVFWGTGATGIRHQILYIQDLALAKNDSPLHEIFQFSNITRPRPGYKQPHGLIRYLTNILLVELVEFLQEMIAQQGDILLPFI